LERKTIEGIAISDLQITESSTTGIEGIYAGIPTLFIAPESENYRLEILEKKLAPKTFSSEGIAEHIANIEKYVLPDIRNFPSSPDTFADEIFATKP